ncbi:MULTISPECIES: acyl-CoA dehydrogenase family protein [unclassified Sphingobium]|uniref:acyl-CoA dehydrogenase family protein n=1 Tax=unclassified Sphingobium TaxID=2611147 RepID=UPI0035A64F02
MALILDDAQRQIADECERILKDSFSAPGLKALLEVSGRYDEAFWQQCASQGWTAITIPEQFGGLGLGISEQGIVAQACGRVACGAPFLGTGYAAAEAIVRHGNAEVQAQWLPRLAAGEVKGALALAEGRDILPAAPAVRFENGRLTGTKVAVPGGGAADVAVVLAAAADGPVLVLADLSGSDTSRNVLPTFDNSRVAADIAFAGTPAELLTTDGVDAARAILRLLAVITGYEQVGGAEEVFAMARSYALDRKAFGQPLAAFQSIKHRLAENYTQIELARGNVQYAAHHAADPHFARYAAAARLSATEAYDTASRDAMQIFGGLGGTWEADLHLHQRRARTLGLECGNAMFWEDELVGELRRGY